MEEILTVREVRGEREKLQDVIGIAIRDFERRAKGVKITAVQIGRGSEKDRRGIRFEKVAVTIIAQIKDGTGATDDYR